MITINIGYSEVIITGTISKKVEDLIVSSNKLGVLTRKTLVPELYKYLKIEKDGVYLSKFWAEEICHRGGWYKREFINWQITAFEIWHSDQEIKILVNGVEFEFNTEEPEWKEDKNVIQMIKYYKHKNRTKHNNCQAFKAETLDVHSKLCCLCGTKDIKILRRKK